MSSSITHYFKENKIVSAKQLDEDALQVIGRINEQGVEAAFRSTAMRALLLRQIGEGPAKGYTVLHRVANYCDYKTARILLRTRLGGKRAGEIQTDDGKLNAAEMLTHRIKLLAYQKARQLRRKG